jgi:quercetin dioxygenase-like cupin family protein
MYAIHQSELPFVGMSHEFVGKERGGVGLSIFIVMTDEPGRGTRLHKHDYDEIVYVIEGRSRWTISGAEREAVAGDLVVVHAGEAHKFVNSGDVPLRQFDMHMNPTFETTWLE